MFLLAFLTLFIAIANAFPPSKEPIEVRNAVLVVDPRDLSTAEIIVDWRLPKYGSAAAHTRIRTKNTRPGEMPSGKYNVYPFTYFIATAELPIPEAIPYGDIPPDLTIEENPELLQPLRSVYAERWRYLKLRFGDTHEKFYLAEPIKLKVRASFNDYLMVGEYEYTTEVEIPADAFMMVNDDLTFEMIKKSNQSYTLELV